MNENQHTLHSGSASYDTKDWSAEIFENESEAGVKFTLQSPMGTSGFSGNVEASGSYVLNDANAFRMTIEGSSDEATLFNPTNHAYFNIMGTAASSIDHHRLTLHADQVAETRADNTTTGNLLDVAGTQYDFREPKLLGDTALNTSFILNQTQEADLILISPDRKVTLSIQTTEPNIILYTTGEGEAGKKMKHGTMVPRGSVAIEPQKVPGTEKYPQLGSIVLKPQEKYMSEMIYQLVAAN